MSMTCRTPRRLCARVASMLPTMYPTGILVATLFVTAFADPPQLPPQPLPGQDSTGAASSQSTALVPLGETNDDGQPLQMSEFCFFGKYPSATCRFRCHLMNNEAYCDDKKATGEGMCMCRPEITPQPAPEESSQDLFTRPETHKEQEEEKKAKKPEDSQHTSEEDKSTQYNPTFTIPMHTPVQEPEEDQNKHHVVFYIFDLNKIFGPQPNDTKAEGSQTEVPEPQAAPAGWAFQHFIALLIVLLLLVLISLELLACYKKQRAKNTDMETIFKNIPMPNKA